MAVTVTEWQYVRLVVIRVGRWQVAPPELFIELCPYLFERCATTVRDTRVERLSMAHRFAIAVFDLR